MKHFLLIASLLLGLASHSYAQEQTAGSASSGTCDLSLFSYGPLTIVGMEGEAPGSLGADYIPQFPGGVEALSKYLVESIRWPKTESDVQGRVIVQFTVSKEGKILQPKVVSSLDPLFDAEAIRLVKSMPQWIPGKEKGKQVALVYTAPIVFKLQ